MRSEPQVESDLKPLVSSADNAVPIARGSCIVLLVACEPVTLLGGDPYDTFSQKFPRAILLSDSYLQDAS